MTAPFDWATSIKPLLAASYNNFNFNPDLFKLARSIESSSAEILNHDAEFEPFYSSFVALSTHFICFNSASVPKTQLPSVLSACNVLMDFILSRLEKHYDQTSVTPKQLVLLVKGLCKGIGCLQRSDTITLTAVMKSSQFPPRIRSTIGPDKTDDDVETALKISRGRSPSTRIDPLSDVLDCLCVPLTVEVVAVRGTNKEKSPKDKKETSSTTSGGEHSKDFKEIFIQENVHYLMRKNAGSVLIDICLKLPFLARYNLMTRDLFQGNVTFPTTLNECQAVQDSYASLRTDIAVVAVVVSLPLLEPLNLDRLNKLCNLGCSCLLAGCSVIASHRVLIGNISDAVVGQECETLANRIVEKSLFVFSTIVNAVQSSHNTGGTQLQNCRLLGAWCLLAGIGHMIKLFDIDGAIVALGQQLLNLLKPILIDLKMDPGKVDALNDLNINTLSTSWQKIKYLNRHVKIVHVLLELASESFSKAVTLRRKPRPSVETPIKDIDQNIPDIDHNVDLIQMTPNLAPSNVESTDAEPLLGNWLEELLASVPQLVDSAGALQAERRRAASSDPSACFGNKDDPSLFLNFAVSCLSATNDHIFTGCRNDLLVENFGFSWTERELSQLANMIRLLEKQSAANFTDGSLLDLNAALIRFVHNLLANGLMSEQHEVSLLSKLNIYIGLDVKDEWPLRISPRILGILGQIMLLRYGRERDDFVKGDVDGIIVNVWQRFIKTLKTNTFADQDIVELNDVNVDHLQLMLLLFHSLSLMQKKTVLLDVSTTILQTIKENRSTAHFANRPSSHFARILLIFDYMIRYFYEPPPVLLEQVKANIFPLQSRSIEGFDKNIKSLLMISSAPRMYYPSAEFEDAYQSNTPTSQQAKMKPLFYNLAPEISCCDVPKLDGLAASFLLNSNDYNELYECLIELLTYDRVQINDETTTFKHTVFSYVSTIVWRLIGFLPPSVQFLQRLNDLPPEKIDEKLLICFLRVGLRLNDASFANWVKDGLLKQKLSAEEAESLVSNVGRYVNTPKFVVDLTNYVLKSKISFWNSLDSSRDSNMHHIYSMTEMVTTDLILSRIYFVLSQQTEKNDVGADLNELSTVLQLLIAKYFNLAKIVLIDYACHLPMDPLPDTPTARNSIAKLMSISTPSLGGGERTYDFGVSCWIQAHQSIRSVMAEWNRDEFVSRGYPSFTSSSIEKFSDQIIPAESFMSAVFSTHMRFLSSAGICSRVAVQQLLSSSVNLLIFFVRKFHPTNFDLKACNQTLTPLLMDITTNYLSSDVQSLMNDAGFYSNQDDEKFFLMMSRYVCSICYDIIIQRCGATDNAISSNILDVVVNFLEEVLDKSFGCEAVVDVLDKTGDVSVLLRTAFTSSAENEYSSKLVRLFNAVFKSAEAHPEHRGIHDLCEKIVRSLVLEIKIHEKWLRIQLSPCVQSDATTERNTNEARIFLDQIAKFLSRSTSCEGVELSKVLLDTLMPLFDYILFDGVDVDGDVDRDKLTRNVNVDFFNTMVKLASVGSAFGHISLLKAVVGWLKKIRKIFSKEIILNESLEMDRIYLINAVRVLCDYVAEALSLYRPSSDQQAAIVYDSDISSNEQEQDVGDDVLIAQVDDDDSAGEDSEEDSSDTKLCTFTLTQKEFMNQHWYHCHTCGMVDGEGVCTVCAKVCHKGHDLSYSKFGSFFCDCGAKGTCQAMVKRSRQKPTAQAAPTTTTKYFPTTMTNAAGVVGQRNGSAFSETKSKHLRTKHWTTASTNAANNAKDNIGGGVGRQNRPLAYFSGNETNRNSLLYEELSSSKRDVVECVTDILKFATPVVAETSKKSSALGMVEKMRRDLSVLHNQTKLMDTVDTLTSASLGSQEGAFENVKLNLTGDIGQTIKHLVASHVIQRVAVCCLNGVEQKKQFLAVAHDRSKISIVNVSLLLKQADGNQKKLSLTRTGSETLPFVVLSMAENCLTDEFLAVCGFKEVHVLTLSHVGTIVDRLFMQPPLEGGNYVLRALWLPNSLTQLAIITADYVRIYDLAESSSQPIFHFMLASGKISDATFVCWERRSSSQKNFLERHLVLLSNSGHLYGQQLSDACDYAVHGAFYITSTVELRHADVTENAGIVGQGGASIYFSSKLQMIFVSFINGKSFCFPFASWTERVDRLYALNWKSSLKSSSTAQALYRWAEPLDHPGVVTALTHSTQNPLIFMIKPSEIQIQEIVVPSKSKVIDATPVRYVSSSSERRTTIVSLGEDGGLRLFAVNGQSTDFWLPKPCVVAFASNIVDVQPGAKKKRTTTTTTASASSTSKQTDSNLETPPFQVDFFETCQSLNEIEYGGNDLLQMYNVQLLKERLNSTSSYVACAKATGFTLEITNNDPTQVICGVRIELGKRNVDKVPSYFEILGRRQVINLTRGRWYDFPLTRDESLASAAKLTVTFGPSRDESGVNFLDGIKIYGKPRDVFGWPEDVDEYASTVAGDEVTEIGSQTKPYIYNGGQNLCPYVVASASKREFSPSEKMLSAFFDVLESYYSVFVGDLMSFHKISIELANSVLVSTMHSETLRKAKHTLRQILPSKNDYYSSKDNFILSFVTTNLQNLRAPIDPELYCLLVSLIRSVVVNRPNVILNEQIKTKSFVELLMNKFWLTYDELPLYSPIAPVGSATLTNCEGLVRALVDILNSICIADAAAIPDVVKAYVSLLFSKHLRIAFACRLALVTLFRKKQTTTASIKKRIVIPTPPRSGTNSSRSGAARSAVDTTVPPQPPSSGVYNNQQPVALDHVAPPPIDLPGVADDGLDQNYELINPPGDDNADHHMQALLIADDDGENAHAHIFDLPAEMDDEQQLVEIAIALSLQEQGADQHGGESHISDHGYALVGQQEILDHGHSSDTTASGMSDEEGSNAATEGSTLRISPVEDRAPKPPGSFESESVGSGAESVSGRSSTFGESTVDPGPSNQTQNQIDVATNLAVQEALQEFADAETNEKLKNKQILLSLVDNFTQYFADLEKLKGIHCVSFLQVIVTLVGSINVQSEEEKKIVERLIRSVLSDLRFNDSNPSNLSKRTQTAEVNLLRLRLLSVFLSKSKGKSKGIVSDTDMFIASYVAQMLSDSGAIEYCLKILKDLVKNPHPSVTGSPEPGSSKVLVVHPDASPPDLSPLFLRPYVKEHAADVFESYTQLITEMALRLPYQIKKVSTMCSSDRSPDFSDEWHTVLCDFMRGDQTSYIKKQVRKLLLFICGSKEIYRCLRDLHTLRFHLESVQKLCSSFSGCSKPNEIDLNRKLMMDYLTLNNMMDHLKSCAEIASSRTSSWQQFCVSSKVDLIYFLKLSCVVDDNMAGVVLSLIQMALGGTDSKDAKKSRAMSVVRRDDKEKFKFSDKLALQIAEFLTTDDVLPLLEHVFKYFLLACNASECRWQMHSIVQSMFEISSKPGQILLLNIFWNKLWPEIDMHGRKASQFVDLLGYYTAKLTPVDEMQKISFKVLDLLKKQNRMLTDHPNAYLYNALSSLLEFDGYYLENNPCLVCNNPEVSMANIKLTSIKMDARYTTTSQMLKLVSSHEIAKIVLKISDVRRPKTVKKLKLYYSNKTVPSAVELKNKPDLWSLAKTFTLTQGQIEVKMDFAVPIVACNLMMEYSEFYETTTTTPETLHCPRCSASVPANPGVCNNCGENVYQCHKCRAINYDEKDPFLCNSCGYSKYAKFDYTVYGRPVAGVESIENEEDRKKTLNQINALLEKADQLYRQLLATRPHIEAALGRTIGQDSKVSDGTERTGGGGGAVDAAVQLQGIGGGLVNRNIQVLALKYNRDCRAAFEDLSKVVQKIIANRAELVEFDRRQRELAGLPPIVSAFGSMQASPDCFGCAAATAQQCILLVRAMASSSDVRQMMASEKDLMNELIEVALKQGSVRARQAARDLVCGIIKDQKLASNIVCDKIEGKVSKAMLENWSPTTMASLVQAELQLLFATLQLMDECWEIRIQCVFKLFIKSLNSTPSGMEAVTLPCLHMIQWLLTPPVSGDKMPAPKYAFDPRPKICVYSWLTDESASTTTFAEFTKKREKAGVKFDPVEPRRMYIMEKYGTKWLRFTKKESERYKWSERLLFCLRSAQMRSAAATLLEHLCSTQPMRKAVLLDLLTKHLSDLEQLGDRAQEFVNLYQNLIQDEQWKFYLVVRNILPRLGQLILKNVDKLNNFEGTSLNTSMSQGFSLKVLCDMLLSFFVVEPIRKRYKKQLLGTVLHSYLGLKRLLIQRTKLIDDAQAKLLQLLELLTTGNEKETEEFMTICIETAKKYSLDDMRTPLFVFERLCSTIYPEEKEVGDFLVNVEKDAAQEDFLQGRMMGNPYSSADTGMGPLMRDVKNKICRDCDLISLLEDDTGMELLVNGKIISLDLPVAEVYKKIWQPHHSGEPMLIVYRMRGLLGDATEEFIESLDSKKNDKVNEEEIYRLSRVVGRCGGLEVMLERLKSIKNVVHAGTMLSVLLTLFDYCVRVRENRIRLFDPKLNSVATLIVCLKPTLASNETDVINLAEKTLTIINRLLSDCESVSEDQFKAFCDAASASDEDFRWLLSQIHNQQVQASATLKETLMQTIANLTLGSNRRTTLLVEFFKPALNFDNYEIDASVKSTTELDAFCILSCHISPNRYGSKVKDTFIETNFVKAATNFLINRCPPLFKIGLTIDSPDWKEFLARPSLKFILRLLAGLCKSHESTQLLVAEDCVPIIHRLEQISSEERLGSLAEILMEALKSNPKVARKIEEVREETKTKKKNLAMAMRNKQLIELGMKISDKGQVRVESTSAMKNATDINEEPGLTCSICREGYKFAPQKLLGIYTFTKRCNAEDFEIAQRKTPGYSTVTHFNVVHLDCHSSAVRSARGREEWESAMLQNANTKCNGLLPVCGLQITDVDYANGLSKHNTYVQEHTGVSDINFNSTVHDLKLLLMRFAQEKSFSEETGGGGRESNVHLIPYLASLSYYILSQTQVFDTQMAKLNTFLDLKPENWTKNSFECEGVVFYAVLSLILCSPKDWERIKVSLMRRLLATAQIRYVAPEGKNFNDRSVKNYAVYRPYLLLFGLIDGIYRLIFQDVAVEKSADWSSAVQHYLKANDAKLLESTDKLLKNFENDLLICETFMEFCDMNGLLTLIPDPDRFLLESVEMIPLS